MKTKGREEAKKIALGWYDKHQINKYIGTDSDSISENVSRLRQ